MKEYGYQAIFNWLYQNDHTIKWLSQVTQIPYSTLRRKLYRQTEWTTTEINKILLTTGKTYEEIFEPNRKAN